MADIMRTSKKKFTVSKTVESKWPKNQKVKIINPIIKPANKR